MHDSVFHAGELAVQTRAGVAEDAAALGEAMIAPALSGDFAAFLAAQPWVIVASATPQGAVWASLLAGRPGFARAVSATEVQITAPLAGDDPLTRALADGPAMVGLLVIEPARRLRIRLNGRAERRPDGLSLQLSEVFGNCPKYIQRRSPTRLEDPAALSPALATATLSPEQAALLAGADTFFLASRHPDRGADASHRGGRPGVLAPAPDGAGLVFPDYRGNNMFQTLGNLSVDPHLGLLVVDFETGRTLQLSGRAEIIWDPEAIARWPRAQRLIELSIDAVLDRPAGSPLRWRFLEASKVNPPVPPPPA